MSMIKKWFEKKKADVKFKTAGKGVKLGDTQAAAAAAAAATGAARPGPSQAKRTASGPRDLSQEQRQAAGAAQSRFVFNPLGQ